MISARAVPAPSPPGVSHPQTPRPADHLTDYAMTLTANRPANRCRTPRRARGSPTCSNSSSRPGRTSPSDSTGRATTGEDDMAGVVLRSGRLCENFHPHLQHHARTSPRVACHPTNPQVTAPPSRLCRDPGGRCDALVRLMAGIFHYNPGVHIADGRRRTPIAQVMLFGATLAFGGWIVAIVQAFLTYNRLMVDTSSRTATPFEWPLLIAGLALMVAYLVARRRIDVVAHSSPDRNQIAERRLAAIAALFIGWYGIAVAQWHLVIRQASTDPSAFTRDPTLLEHLLLIGGGASLLALAGHRFMSRREKRN